MAVVQLERTAGSRRFEAALERMRDGVQAMAAWVQEAKGEDLGEGLIQIRESGLDPLEGAFGGGGARAGPPCAKRTPACCRPPGAWTRASSSVWPRTSSTGSTPRAPSMKPTGRTPGGICT